MSIFNKVMQRIEGLAVALILGAMALAIPGLLLAQENSQRLQDAIRNEALGRLPAGAVIGAPDQKFTLPRGYAESGIVPGQSQAIQGVTIQVEPSPGSWRPIVTGVPLKYVAGLSRTPERATARVLANGLADYYGQLLPKKEQMELHRLYLGTLERAQGILMPREGRPSLANEQAARHKLAELLSTTVLEEFHIFAGSSRKARARRYHFWNGEEIPSRNRAAVQKILAQAFEDLLEGRYIARESPRIAEEQGTLVFGSAEQRAALFRESARLNAPASNPFAYLFAERLGLRQPAVGNPAPRENNPSQIRSWEARIYTAEHSILKDSWEKKLQRLTGWDWSRDAVDAGLAHVSVVGGIWRSSEVREVASGEPGGRSGGPVWRREDFQKWVVADGSASWITAKDFLFLKEVVHFPSYEDAVKYLLGTVQQSGQSFDRMRACSYSVGDYGTNWVCHQNSNAYAFEKWGIIVDVYPTILVFGPFGNYSSWLTGPVPISLAHDPIFHRTHDGGVPGEWLFYEVMPPYALYNSLLLSAMNGGGYRLDAAWSAQNHAWTHTDCAFIPRGIPVAGPSRPPMQVP